MEEGVGPPSVRCFLLDAPFEGSAEESAAAVVGGAGADDTPGSAMTTSACWLVFVVDDAAGAFELPWLESELMATWSGVGAAGEAAGGVSSARERFTFADTRGEGGPNEHTGEGKQSRSGGWTSSRHPSSR